MEMVGQLCMEINRLSLHKRPISMRSNEVDKPDALVITDQDVMGGEPVFAGTRVPVSFVLSSMAAGIPLDHLKASYPFLTEAHVQAAKVVEAGRTPYRPQSLAVTNPELRRRVARVLKRAPKSR